MSSEQAVFARLRARVRRQLQAAEEAEHEGGELNLVPYLDIITNTVIFLLATTVSIVALGNINVNAPRYAEPAAAAAGQAPKNQQQALNLTVTVSYSGFIIAGSGAVLPGPDGNPPTIRCREQLQRARCPSYLGSRVTESGETEPVWVDKYDYTALKTKLKKIKDKYPAERQVILMADRSVPYQTVVRTMDALRGKFATTKCTGKDGCLFDQVILSAGLE